jgi:hypothetical protein
MYFILSSVNFKLLKARTVKPEKLPLLGNGYVTRLSGVTVGTGVFCAGHAKAV